MLENTTKSHAMQKPLEKGLVLLCCPLAGKTPILILSLLSLFIVSPDKGGLTADAGTGKLRTLDQSQLNIREDIDGEAKQIRSRSEKAH